MQRIHTMLNYEFGFDIMSGGRKRVFVDARRIFVQILNQKYDLHISKPFKVLTLGDVGKYIGNQNHATVLNLLRNFDALCSWEPSYLEIYNRVLKKTSDDISIQIEVLHNKKEELLEELVLIEQSLKKLQHG